MKRSPGANGRFINLTRKVQDRESTQMSKLKRGTVLICSNYAWTVLNFRLPLIKRLSQHGYRVVVVTQYDGYEEQLAD